MEDAPSPGSEALSRTVVEAAPPQTDNAIEAESRTAVDASIGGNLGRPPAEKLEEPKKPSRPPTAYFVFLNKHRSAVRAANPDLSMGQLGKKLGSMWRELTEADKLVFTEEAAKAKLEYEEKMRTYADDVAAFVAAGGVLAADKPEESDPGVTRLPQSRIRHIVKRDPDVKNVTREGLFAITVCTELFIGALAEVAHKVMLGTKRKGINYDDVAGAVRRESTYRFLQADFPRKPSKKSKKTKAPKAPQPRAGQSIAKFFGAPSAPSSSTSAASATASVSAAPQPDNNQVESSASLAETALAETAEMEETVPLTSSVEQ